METLLKQLRELPGRLKALPAATRNLLLGIVGVLLVGSVSLALLLGKGDNYQYAFTNLNPDDGAAAAQQLTAAGIRHRLEAGGNALSVPAEKVYEARMLLASLGIPKAGGVGFELFDKGDIGVSEFTQRVNLRRAIEGELSRTIGALTEVRSARVHVTLAEKGLYRDEDRPASASVVINLHPGRALGDAQLSGIRHLVSSAVPGLGSKEVTVVDGRGTVLSTNEGWGNSVGGPARQIEADLERRIISLLEPAVGAGSVVARVSATLDTSEVSTSTETYDPDGSVVKNERRITQSALRDGPEARGLAGAAGNQPGNPAAGPNNRRGESNSEDETRSFELSRTVTKSVSRAPRIERLSVAILLDGVDGLPRDDAEVARLGALAQKAVGLDPGRGDQFEITSVAFAGGRSAEADVPVEAPALFASLPGEAMPLALLAVAALAVAIGVAAAIRALRRGRTKHKPTGALEALRTDTAAALAQASEIPFEAPAALADPAIAVRDRARELAALDPARAAHLLRAWLAADVEAEDEVER